MPRKIKCKQCSEYFEKPENPNDLIMAFGVKFCSKQCRLKFTQAKQKKENEKQLARMKKQNAETKRKEKNQKKLDKKRNSPSYLKKKLWEIVSLYIRLRDSNDDNFCKCCTCNNFKHYKDSMQAGHYIPQGSSSFHKYNEKNIHAQCYGCNVGKGGNLIEYRPFMINKYGLEYTEWLFKTRNEMCKLGSVELKELIEQYKTKLNEIKSVKAID